MRQGSYSKSGNKKNGKLYKYFIEMQICNSTWKRNAKKKNKKKQKKQNDCLRRPDK